MVEMVAHNAAYLQEEDNREKAMHETAAEFRQDDVLISKTLESSCLHDGGWTPVGIKELLLSGKKLVVKAVFHRNPEQSRLGEATEEGLTRVAQLILRIEFLW